MKKLLLPVIFCFIFLGCKKEDEKSAIGLSLEGKSYNTIVISGQEWTTENYNGSQGVYYNNEVNNTHGKLLSLYDTKEISKLLSNGWRIPTIKDYVKLIDNFGGFQNSNASKMSNEDIIDEELKSSTVNKLLSSTDWALKMGNNQSEFNIFPSGEYEKASNSFTSKGNFTFLWTSDIVDIGNYYLPIALGFRINDNNEIEAKFAEYPQPLLNKNDNSKESGSLRLVRDL